MNINQDLNSNFACFCFHLKESNSEGKETSITDKASQQMVWILVHRFIVFYALITLIADDEFGRVSFHI